MDFALAKKESALGATLLVTGCCVGAGMIGLPVVSAMAGFVPSAIAMFICYLFATGTGLLLLEATLWFDQRVSLLSIAHRILGKGGKLLTACLFLFLFYCLFVAYIDGGGQLFAHMLSALTAKPVSREIGIAVFIAVLGSITYAGTRAVDHVNRFFVLGLAALYLLLISYGLPQVNIGNFQQMNWKASLAVMPILLISFGYQNLVPSITFYLKRNVAAVRFAIMAGNLIPFVIYFIWNFVILGMLPDAGSPFFVERTGENEMVAGLLERASESKTVIVLLNVFSLFAILTSFLANAISFVDFIKDGLKPFGLSALKEDLAVYALLLIPPTVCSLSIPHLFLKALGFAGGVADVLLFGILPVLLICVGRYILKIKGPYEAPGGKGLPAFVFTISLFLLAMRGF